MSHSFRRIHSSTPLLFVVLMGALGGLCASPVLTAEPAAVISFNRDIRPILSDKCFACHGFDAKHREADLRLDTFEGAYGTLSEGRVAIKPGDLKGSELWQRITSDDPQHQMPPAESHKSLSVAEKETLKRWIEQGAAYQKHWAFEPPVLSEVPTNGTTNPIDAFIVDRLKSEGFDLSPAADRETLLRRVSFDLTGLPPTPEEIDAFLADTSPDAYEKQVERLLASSRYGERMATFWLDMARYGDTNGYLHDLLRTGWPWRDWVIQAFNDDMPFEQFVVEQLAGDLLPAPTEQQTYGQTDEFSYNVAENPLTAHDLHATMLHCLGIDHTRFTYKSQGLDFKLTGVEPSRVIQEILT